MYMVTKNIAKKIMKLECNIRKYSLNAKEE